jgi:hypothetical protein
MKTPALILGFLVACVAAFTGCSSDTARPQDGKEIVAFSFLAANNPGLSADAAAQITGNSITATLPAGTDVTALVATFETTGVSVTVGGVTQASGVTANNFSTGLAYHITAADHTSRDFVATVRLGQATAKQLTSYAFLKASNAGLGADVTATINGTSIAATVPFGTNVGALVATFATTGTSVKVGSTAQVSGTTANNFASVVTYTVTAADASTQDYTVTVTVAPSSAKAITSYKFLAASNPGVLTADVTATVTGTAIAATVPTGTDVTALVATFATTGASVKVGGTAQVSGTTANNFTSPVMYTVTAADSTTQIYTVTVTVALSSAKAITAYSFLSTNNAGVLTADVTATINGTAIAATVPFGTSVTGLIATFATTGTTVKVGGTTQVSNTTANNFTSPVAYVVTAADGTTQTYTVTVTAALNPAKAITAYSFLSAKNPGVLTADVIATINGTAIAATVPFGTDVTGLIATFTTTGANVKVGGTTQASGITPNNFASPVSYLVTAADGTTQTYTVTVTVALNPAKAITAYSFLTVNNAGLTANVAATISGTSIDATVPTGTDVTALIATFATTGASVKVGTTTQVSDMTANSFASPVVYTVTAADGTTADYTVTVTVAASSAKAITAFAFLSANNAALGADVTATISGTSIDATVPFGTNVGALVATYATTGASVTVGGAAQTSGMTANNFAAPLTYHVTANDSSTQDYTVTVTVAQSPAKAITAFAFLSASNPGLAADVTATIAGTSIDATLPAGTNVTALVATFSTTGVNVKVGATVQFSGTTANDFTTPAAYVVTAADGTTQTYTVTVTVAAAPKDLTAFAFLAASNAVLPADVTATITGTTITATVPFGTNVTALVATFTTTGASVKVGGTTQSSGTTPNDFTTPVAYTVIGVDGSTAVFTVTVTITLPTLMVVRVGDGAAALSAASTATFVEKRSVTDGAVLQTIPLPTTGTPFTLAGNATSEGGLSRSADGRFVTLAGYAATTGVANIATTLNVVVATATNRVVARLDATGTVDASTLLFNAFSGSNVRAATSVDGSSFWVSGTSSGTTGGVQFVQFGSTGTTTRVLSVPDNSRWSHVFGGQLYESSNSGTATTGVLSVGAGLPTTAGATATRLVNPTNAYGFVLLDRNPVVSGLDTLYVALDATPSTANHLNVQKFTFDGTVWTPDAAFQPAFTGSTVGARGLAAWADVAGVHVIATTNETATIHLVSFLDDGVNKTPTVTTLAAAPTNTAFRGVALSPGP